MYVLARSTYDSQCCRRESQKPIQIYQWHKVNAKKVHIVRLVDGVSDGFLLSPHNFDIYIYICAHVCCELYPSKLFYLCLLHRITQNSISYDCESQHLFDKIENIQ